MLIVLIEGMALVTSSYTCGCLSAVVVSRSFKALMFAFLLVIMIQHMTITVVETTRLTTRAVAREMMDITEGRLLRLSRFIKEVRCTDIELFGLSVIVLQMSTTVCTATVHVPSVGRSVQVTLVWLVVVGQLPQFDDRIL